MTFEDLENAGMRLGLAKNSVSREINRQLNAILPAASDLFEKVCGEHEELVKKSPDEIEARKNWGIEQKLIRSILHIILNDMERSLRASMKPQARQIR